MVCAAPANMDSAAIARCIDQEVGAPIPKGQYEGESRYQAEHNPHPSGSGKGESMYFQECVITRGSRDDHPVPIRLRRVTAKMASGANPKTSEKL